MRSRLCAGVVAALVISFCIAPLVLHAQPARSVDPSLYAGMRWRNVGPFRGGRALAVTGVPGDPRTFYFGAVGGGVWKTQNAGRTWTPIMDNQPVASIGAIAVAPSNPATVYVGSGEADMRSDIIHGNGMYRSTDAGSTWTRIGLEDSRQIGRILVNPRDAKTLLVAALGHAYGPNDVRGVYRSTDGGATWNRTLFRDSDTGAIDLASDPSMHVVYASLWQTRRPPWSVYPPSNGPGSSLWKSTDGGVTWTELRGNGLPSEQLGKIGLAVAPSNPQRVYAIVNAKEGGLYRSDDAGAHWKLVDGERRIWQRGWYFCRVSVDPKNADAVYLSNTAFYRSTDGGSTFTATKGSPNGDDFHELWIDPNEPQRMILGSDQGATVSLDGSKTWSSWFNQPTAQFYHVAVDSSFPYRLFGAQQDSGAAMVPSQSSHTGIDERDWRPITAGGESGTIVADPHNPQIIFGRQGDTVAIEDLRTAQTRTHLVAATQPGVWRNEWTMPLAWGADGALYTSHQVVWRSRDRGAHWTAISGDLARPHPGAPATLDATTARDAEASEPRGVVYALAPAVNNPRVVWAGTDDGLVYVTRDGGATWRNVTPPPAQAWSHIDTIEASHVADGTAYVAIDNHRLDDDRPFIAITHDFGRTWRTAVAGLPSGNVNVVREDPQAPGLLYAGTETGVFVSLDDGALWNALQLNLPVVSVRDIAVHDDDLAIATHGRGFWILDDVAPLRELARNASTGARLFAPRAAIRIRPGTDEAEPLPPETPRGENPAYGAMIDYVVPGNARGPLTLTVSDARGTILRRWSSTDRPKPTAASEVDYPAYWIAQPAVADAAPGMHRFAWDFRSAGADDAPLVPPGRYTVSMQLDARTYIQQLTINRDPRIVAGDADLAAQYGLASQVYAQMSRVKHALELANTTREKADDAMRVRIDAIRGASSNDPNGSFGAQPAPSSLSYLAGALDRLYASIESADTAPTSAEQTAWSQLRATSDHALRAWAALIPK